MGQKANRRPTEDGKMKAKISLWYDIDNTRETTVTVDDGFKGGNLVKLES